MFLLLLLVACDAGERFPDGCCFESGFTRFDSGGSGGAGFSNVSIDGDGLGFTVSCRDGDMRVEPFAEGVVRLSYGSADSYAVSPPAVAPDVPDILTYSDVVVMRTSTMGVILDPSDCRVTIEDADGNTILEEPAGGGYTGGDTITLSRSLADGERIYGFGERTGGLDRVGGSYSCWNTDAYDAAHGGWGPTADPLYQCIPFYVSKRGSTAFGVFTDVTRASTWDVGATDPDLYTVTMADGPLDQYLVSGPGFADVAQRYTALTGRAPLPPRWSLGFHQSRWGWSPDTAVTDVVDGFRARNLPLDAVWLDIQHMDGFRSWTWDPDTFPDPAGLVETLAADGVRAVSIVDPAIKVDPGWEIYDEGVAEGYFLGTAGEPWVGEVWPGDSVFPDFTDPRARAWWGRLGTTDLGHGIAGFWLDMNEPSEFTLGTVPDTLETAGDGAATTMADAHNVYALLEAQATFTGMLAAAPDQRPFLLTRAGYAGIQRYAAAWTGDAPSTWDSLAGTLPMLLGMGLSGESWVGSDVGGYSGGASGELYARWMQVGALSPFFRAHLVEGVADQYPWSFGTEVEDISRSALELRSTLLPYLYSLAWSSSQTGVPPLVPLVWEFPADDAVGDLGDQALLGPWLLLAPIVTEGATSRDVYLPEGRWFAFETGVVYDGPATITLVDQPLAALPIFVREGAIVPRGPVMAWNEAAPVDPLTLEVWPSVGATRFTVYEDAGDGYAYEEGGYAATTWSLQGSSTGATLSAEREGTFAPPDRPVRVRVRRVDSAPTAVRLDGAALTNVGSGDALDAAVSGWWWDSADLSLWVVVPDTGAVSLEFVYDPAITDPAPAVAMPFSVTLPSDTPTDTPICIASSADGWESHTPLTRVGDVAYGTIQVPRGEYLYYKYTRGDWDTVEKWPDCAEASDRYELGRATPVKADTVYGWADGCP
ncbi:MAG: glycoside hydrolase family 31 protein [Pseudomonadota bacterium]|nr:glycoside hydrolase family 31 protein [Pseudomonadota bacterium]